MEKKPSLLVLLWICVFIVSDRMCLLSDRCSKMGKRCVVKAGSGGGNRKRLHLAAFFPVPTDVLFSNQMLEDLDKIWALRDVIPDPNVIETDQQKAS